MQEWTATHWLPSACELGESPLYRASDDSLFFVDIEACRLFHIHLDQSWSAVRSRQFREPVSSIHLTDKDDVLAVTTRLAFSTLHLDTFELTALANVHDGDLEHPRGRHVRFNDGAIDAQGRWFAGTMHHDLEEPVGGLWRFHGGVVDEVVEDSVCPNGIGWSLDNRIMYWTETPHKTIYQFDYDSTTGGMTNRRVFVKLEEGSPDGLAVDEEGCVWTAANGTGKVLRYSPSGELLGQVIVPRAQGVTCPCFGGRDMTELFITTMKDESGESGGDVFRCRVGVKGRVKNSYPITQSL